MHIIDQTLHVITGTKSGTTWDRQLHLFDILIKRSTLHIILHIILATIILHWLQHVSKMNKPMYE